MTGMREQGAIPNGVTAVQAREWLRFLVCGGVFSCCFCGIVGLWRKVREGVRRAAPSPCLHKVEVGAILLTPRSRLQH